VARGHLASRTVKNPLAPIRAAVETLRRLRALPDHSISTEYFDEAARTVLDEVHRIANIVTEFTRFARLLNLGTDVDVGRCRIACVVGSTDRRRQNLARLPRSAALTCCAPSRSGHPDPP
jgi:signal transduction histidine kinase